MREICLWFVVQDKALPTQEDEQAPIAKAPALPGQRQKQIAQFRIDRRPLQQGVPGLKGHRPLGFRDLQAAEFAPPVVECRLVVPVLAAQTGRLRAQLVLLQILDDLLFRKPIPVSPFGPPLKGQNPLQAGSDGGGNVTT